MITKLALIGCGGVSSMHLEGCQRHPDRVRVVAACDPDANMRQKRQSEYDIPFGCATFEELQNTDWDAAIICTPTSVRQSVVETLARAGKPLFIEKPFAASYEEARAMVEVAEKYGAMLAIDQNFRFHYPFHTARQLIAGDEIGAVSNILHCDWFFRQDAGWRIEQPRHAMMVMGVHWLDGLRWILDCDATSVFCQTHSSDSVNCTGETEANVLLQFTNGTIANYSQSFSSAINQTETTIIGETGTLVVNYNGVTLHKRGQEVQRWDNAKYAGENKPESAFAGLEELLSAIENKIKPANSGRDNLKTIALLEASYQSAQSGQMVNLKNGELTS